MPTTCHKWTPSLITRTELRVECCHGREGLCVLSVHMYAECTQRVRMCAARNPLESLQDSHGAKGCKNEPSHGRVPGYVGREEREVRDETTRGVQHLQVMNLATVMSL